MNSTLDDLENGEDLNELESRLYAQIHHEAPPHDILTPQPLESEISPVPVQRVVTNTSVINNVNVADSKLSNRYWFNSQNTQQVVQRKKWQDNPKTDIEITNNNEIMKLKEKTFRPFMAYEPIISSLVNKSDDSQPLMPQNDSSVYQKQVVKNKNDNRQIDQQDQTEPSVSKINPANITKKNQLKLKKQRQREKNLQNQRKHVTGNRIDTFRPPVNEMDTQMQKKLKYNKKTGVGLEKDEPLVRNFLKMQRTLKLQAKKIKAKAARQKNVQKPAEKVEPISFDLSTDDETNDDVIIIPVPPPPIVTINDTSSEDGEETVVNKTKSKRDISITSTEASFVKPKSLKSSSKTVLNINDSNSSRCASPCSVISTDDFIAQADRSRLLHDRIIVNDDDLICIEDNVENYIENPPESHSRVGDDNRQLTTQVSNRRNSVKNNDYHETQDVYCESESDIQESIYTKSSKMHTQTTKTSVIIEESSSETNSDCCVESDNMQKIKRLRKRRASSSNKETELSNNDSTDSNGEETTTIINEINTSITTLPFITRGEAVEKCKVKSLKKKQRTSQSSRIDVNSSDNEFINMLQTFAKGGKSNNSKVISLAHYSDESTKSEEDLTARTIAEEILNKFDKKSKQSNEKNSNNVENLILQNSETIEEEHCNKDSDRSVPILDMELMEKQFAIIDQIPNFDKISNINSNNNNMDSDLADITTENEQNISNSSNIYNIIHTNSSNIGWNEEMYRFYNCSWGGENFNVNQIRKKMDRKARWTVHTEDRFPKHKKYSNIRCNNCFEMGHIQAKCTQPKKPLMCSMCGETGHREPRCPNTICLRCGKKTRVFVKSCNACATQNRLFCPICNIRGHGIDFCPDKWRRYHSTILNNAQPNSTIIYSSKKFCCICAGRGHLSENCKVAYRFSEYPPTLTQIKSHRKSYDDQKKVITLLQNVNSYNLLYEPDDSINFSFSTNSNITTKQYYGRYLNAVGLNHIMKSAGSNKRKVTDIEPEKSKEKVRRNNNRYSQDDTITNNNDQSQSKNLVRNPFSIQRKSLLPATEVNNMEEGLSMEMADNTIIDDSENCIEQLDTTNKCTEIEELNNNNSVLPEHHFKSPNIFVEKSSVSPEQTDLNKSEDITQNSAIKETLNLDSDSNYSFSEHFDVNIITSTPAKISRSRPMEELPDFIPLNSNDDNVVNDDNFNVNDDILEIATDINPNSDDDTADFENTFKLPDIPCVAKIYLKKDFSDYLLSPEGNKFLVDNSNKFDVKASIDWTRVGNILVLEGLRDNQDKFHTELLLAFRTLPDKLNRKELEKGQQVPRKRIKMIRFLSENLRLLQKSNLLSADVNLLYKQLQDYENKNSQTSWKMAEKTRRTLNMILFGKVGLRNGKENLDLLVNSLKSLALLSEEELISNEIRENISKSWKYIFSSQKHDNYKELVEIFYDMKRKNLFPKLKINGLLWSRNILNLSLTENEKNEILSDCSNYSKTNSTINNLKQSQQYNNSGSFNDSSSTTTTSNNIPKLTLDTSEPIISKDLTNISLNINTNIKNNSINQSFSEFLTENLKKENCQLEWENECIKLLTQIENCTKNCSKYWSKQSIKIINSCIIFYKSHQLLYVTLQKILQKANNSLLSYNDHRDILKIYHNSKISES